MDNTLTIRDPELNIELVPGCKVKLGRFESVYWLVDYGWFSWGGNREMCGWYLTQVDNPEIVKPLYKTDLDDCYLVTY